MHVKLQKLLLRMSRIGMYAMILHYSFFTLAMANDTEAQRKKLHEIRVKTNLGNQSFLNFLGELEKSSDFIFAYSKQEVKSKSVQITKSEWTMDELLILTIINGNCPLCHLFHRLSRAKISVYSEVSTVEGV